MQAHFFHPSGNLHITFLSSWEVELEITVSLPFIHVYGPSVIKRFFLYHQVLHSSTNGLTSAETGHNINDIESLFTEVPALLTNDP